MAPTICSGKKRQTRTILTTNIRRHGQGSQHLNQTLSNIVNFVARGSLSPKIPASLRIQNHNITERNINTTGNHHSTNNDDGLSYNLSTHTSAIVASGNRRQQISFLSDNAVTSSTHSDTENSFDLRLVNDILSNDSTSTYGSNTIGTSNATSLLPSSLSDTVPLSSHKAKTSSQRQERLFRMYPTVMQANSLTDDGEDRSDNDETNLCENENISELNPGNERQQYFQCSDFDSDEDELESTRELNNSDVSCGDSDTDMGTDESDSMTSLDTEKSAKLKRGNHPQLRDKLVSKQQTNNNNSNSSSNIKSYSNLRNTDGLLSIAIKTIKLVKRNQLLQQRLTQLQLETSEFIKSVLANPENRHFRENIKQKV